MKPIKLEFSGLNSYRACQTVDFEELGKNGLFGIFGPTGSGKSSILDAITLVLYGKVDRAENNTRGIINLREKAAEVLFTFELGGSRYTVQRRYERLSSDPEKASDRNRESVRARGARLVKDDTEVLADRPETVTRAMEKVIGLSCEEFCRAVVLPQGKFSEFLTLRGAERAEMLGRIFDLDKFGEPLFQKASARRDKWQAEVDSIERAKAELGDCSDEEIREAEIGAQDLEAALSQAEENYEKTKSAYDQAVNLKFLYERLRSAEERKAGLEGQKDEIEEAVGVLDGARRAAPLRSIIDTIRRLDRDRVKTEEELKDATVNSERADRALESAVEATKSAREEQEREEPVLTARKTRLEEALKVQLELSGLLKKHKNLSNQLKSTEDGLQKARDLVKDREARLEAVDGLVESLSAKLAGLSVDPTVRDLVEKAYGLLAPLQSAATELASSKKDLDKKTAGAEGARANVLRVYAELVGLAASRYTWSDSGDLVAGEAELPSMEGAKTGSELLAVADREIQVAARLVGEAGERAERAFIHDQAVVLAQSLEEGQPCPVCGSEYHPCVASGDGESFARAKKAKSMADSCLSQLQSWRNRLVECTTSWDNLRLNEFEARDKVEKREGEFAEARNEFLAAARAALGDAVSEDSARADIQAAKNRILEKDREHSKISRLLQEAQDDQKTIRKELEEVRAHLSGLERERDTRTTEINLLLEQIDERKAKVQEITGGEDPQAAMSRAEAAIRALRERVKQAEDKEEECRKEADRLAQEVAKIESALSQMEKELREQKAALAHGLSWAGFETEEQAEKAMLPDDKMQALDRRIQEYRRAYASVEGQIRDLEEQIGSREFSEPEFRELEARVEDLDSRVKTLREEHAVAVERLNALKGRRERWDSLEADRLEAEKKRDLAARLAILLRRKALVKFLAEEHLRDMAVDASTRLGSLTGQRYALEISGESDFVIRDDYNGGERRSVNTLSGGETFLTSLSLALALSSKIQLRGEYPLGFFFLDEGFGTLDDEKLDAVITALERLHDKDRMVGVISHVKELKERLPRCLEVAPARGDGSGSAVILVTR
jgi:exonuclease SbcC